MEGEKREGEQDLGWQSAADSGLTGSSVALRRLRICCHPSFLVMQASPGGNLTFRNEACNPICCGPCADLRVMLAVGIAECGSRQDIKGRGKEKNLDTWELQGKRHWSVWHVGLLSARQSSLSGQCLRFQLTDRKMAMTAPLSLIDQTALSWHYPPVKETLKSNAGRNIINM